jgi:hypothetical protein
MASLIFLMSVSKADAPKFTADQCRVMKQVGIDTRGICPQTKTQKKRRE